MKALLFDKDGTLFSFEDSWGPFVHKLIEEYAPDDPHAQAKLSKSLGYNLRTKSFAPDSICIAGSMGEIVAAALTVLADWSEADLTRRLVASAAEADLVPVTELVPLFEHFRALGLKIGLATNDAEAAARAHLANAEVTDLFDFIAGCDSGFGAKPAPGMCLAFADAMGIAPEEIAMVGDSLHDLRAGQAAGMVRIGVLTGTATAEDLEADADVILPDIGHLPDWLAGAALLNRP